MSDFFRVPTNNGFKLVDTSFLYFFSQALVSSNKRKFFTARDLYGCFSFFLRTLALISFQRVSGSIFMLIGSSPVNRNSAYNLSEASTRGVLERCSYKYRKIHRKTYVSVSFIKKRLWPKCFPVNFAKFLRTIFLQDTSGPLSLKSFLFKSFGKLFCIKNIVI